MSGHVLCWLPVILAITAVSVSQATTRTHFVHWNTSNPIFRIDNTDHIIDVNVDNLPWEYDQANIICPVYKEGEDQTEKSVIYNVSKEEYETCRITNPNPRVIAVCDQPHKLMFFTITFRSFTPTPGGMEFKPGHDYYFISTSSKDDLYRRVGGRCNTHNMKVTFKVADNTDNSNSNHVAIEQQTDLDLINEENKGNKVLTDDRMYYTATNEVLYKDEESLMDKVNVIKQEASRMKHEASHQHNSQDALRPLIQLVAFALLASLAALHQ